MTEDVHKNFRKCIVLSCGGKKSSLVHKFPSDNEKAIKWKQIINNPALKDLSIDVIRKKYFVCSIHFKPSDYKNVESRSINTTAYPSLHLEAAQSPAHHQVTRSTNSKTVSVVKLVNSQSQSNPEILEDLLVVDSNSCLPECYSIINFDDNQKLEEVYQTMTPEPPKKRFKVTLSHAVKLPKKILKPRSPVKKLPTPTDLVEPEEPKQKENTAEITPPNKLMALFELTPEQYEKVNKHLAAGKTLPDLFNDLPDNKDDMVAAMPEGTYVKLPGPLLIDFFWLRDHCRCELCYNHETFQRKISISDIPDDIKILNSTLNDEFYNVVWSDHHVSSYTMDFLRRYNTPQIKNESALSLWSKEEIERNQDVARVAMKDYLCDEFSSKMVVQSLLKYGVAFVEECSANQQSTEFVVRHLFPVRKTLFGEMWTFSDSLDHADTAYTKEYLGPHNDNIYFNDASGLQILHCIQHQDGNGGDNFLVDGFKVCKQLQDEHPDVFKRLCTTHVVGEYIEEGKHHKYSGPTIKLDSNGELLQVRFNLYDRAPLGVPIEKVRQFYGDLKLFAKIVEAEEYQWRFKLNPGTVMMFDNWRLLHGRFSYTGKRTMTGCYVSRTEFQSKARHLKLID